MEQQLLEEIIEISKPHLILRTSQYALNSSKTHEHPSGQGI